MNQIKFILDNKELEEHYNRDFYPTPTKGDVIEINGTNYDVYEIGINFTHGMEAGDVTVYARTR